MVLFFRHLISYHTTIIMQCHIKLPLSLESREHDNSLAKIKPFMLVISLYSARNLFLSSIKQDNFEKTIYLDVKVPYHQMLTKRYLNTYFFIIGDKAVITTLSCHCPICHLYKCKVIPCTFLQYS